jgi:hypothetical protein
MTPISQIVVKTPQEIIDECEAILQLILPIYPDTAYRKQLHEAIERIGGVKGRAHFLKGYLENF